MDYDLAVVGAGVAGLTAARHASQRGLRVAVVDPHPRGDGRINSTEAVPDTVFGTFHIPTEGPHVSERITHVRMWDDRGRHVGWDSVKRWGATLDMRRFRGLLASECADTDFIAARFVGFAGDTHRLRLDNGRTVTAEYAIGADGVNSRVAAAAGFDDPFPSSEWSAAGQWLVEGERLPRNTIEVYWAGGGTPVSIPGGYGWCFSKGLGPSGVPRAWVGLAMGGQHAAEGGVRDAVERLLAWRVPDSRKVEWDGGRIPMTMPRPRVSQGNVMLVGDAAWVCTPHTAEGIRPAMWSAMLAAEAMAAGVRPKGMGPTEVYEEWFGVFLRSKMKRFYRLKQKLIKKGVTKAQYWAIRAAVRVHRLAPGLIEEALSHEVKY